MIQRKLLLSMLFSILFLFGQSQGNGSTKETSIRSSSKDFTSTKSNVTVVTSGRRGGATSYTYFFELVSKHKQNIVFDSLWTSGYRLKLSASKIRTTSDSLLTLEKGDTISLKASNSIKYKSPSNKDKFPEANSFIKSPLTYNGKALLRYYKGTKQYYYTIPNISNKRINLP